VRYWGGMHKPTEKSVLFLSVVDQALSSASNFLLAMAVLSVTTAKEYGAFGIFAATYAMSLGVSRSMHSDSMPFLWAAGGPWSLAQSKIAVTRAVLRVATVISVGCVCISAFVSPYLAHLFLVYAAGVIGLLLQDLGRFSAFAIGRPAAAVASDGWWLTVQLVGSAVVFLEHGGGEALCAVWALGGAAGAVSLFASRLVDLGGVRRGKDVAARSWYAATSTLWPRYLAEAVLLTVSAQVFLIAFAALCGLQAAGILRAGQVVFSPLNVAFFGAVLGGVPLLAARLRSGRLSVKTFRLLQLSFVALIIVAAALSTGAAVLAQGTSAFRGKFELGVVLAVSITTIAAGATVIPSILLRAAGAATQSLRVRMLATPGTLLLPLVVAVLTHRAQPTAWAMAVGACGSAVVWIAVSDRVLSQLRHGSELVAEAVEPDRPMSRWPRMWGLC
jgi:hypothetical protein